MVDGDVNIPNGTYSAHTIADLIAAIGLPGTEEGASTVANLMEQQAPLLSKLAGPFHLRNPYYARYATTFQMVTIPFPPVIVITPVPTPKENLWVFGFRAKTFAYTAGLNATLGENLYTQADWWPFGNGVVPMALNLDLIEALKSAGAAATLVTSAELDPEAIEGEVRGFLETMMTHGVQWAFDEAIQKLVDEGARIVAGPFGGFLDIVNAVKNEVAPEEETIDGFYEEFVDDFQSRLGNHGKTLLGELLENTDVLDADKYLKEYAGLLIYGNNINIGPDAKQVSGMLVAQQDINCEAKLTIGTLLAREGSIRVADFLYYPYFNQASLYVPKEVPGDTVLERAVFEAYGAAHDSGAAVQVGPPPVTNHMTSGGWEL